MYKLCQNMVFRVVHFQIFWHWLILCKLMFTPDLSDWMAYHVPPWFLGSGHSVDFVLAMCAHPLGNHMHFMPKSIYFINPALQRIMPICGFHWHSRYSIWISTFVLLHCVWFPGSSCGHKLLSLIICHENWFIASRIAWMPNVHCIYW